MTAGLLAIMWAMWRVVDVLAPQPWSFEDIVAAWDKTPSAGKHKGGSGTDVGRYFKEHRTALGGFNTPSEILAVYEESEPDREGLNDLVSWRDSMMEKVATISLQSRFQALRWQIAGGVLIGAVGIIAFEWAANPAEPVQPKPSLINADLSGADLSGASLRNVNLTGANLKGADLTGADVSGATLQDVVWGNTACPDGTNSDASAGNASGSVGAPGTCVGT